MELRKCEFSLVRYVPNPVRNEFVNIGIILRRIEEVGGAAIVRFTRDWSRVLGLDPDADTDMLESLEQDIRKQLAEEGGSGKKVLETLEGTLSLSVQISEPTGILAQDLDTESEQLMRTYVE